MALSKEDVALRLAGFPSDQQRALQNLFESLIGDVATGGADAATTTTAGVVKQAAHQADSVATDVAGLKTDLNTLLGSLQTAGIMASS